MTSGLCTCVRCLLIFCVLLNRIQRAPPTWACKVAPTPKRIHSNSLMKDWKLPGSNMPRWNTFEAIHELRYRYFWRVMNEEMNVIALSVELFQLRFKIFANLSKSWFHELQNFFCEEFFSIFCYKHQMYMHEKYTMPSMPNSWSFALFNSLWAIPWALHVFHWLIHRPMRDWLQWQLRTPNSR